MNRKSVLVPGLCALALASCQPPATTSHPPATAEGMPATGSTSTTRVQRGQYLATIMGCHDCHTPGSFYGSPDQSRLLSGSELGWQGPWGVSFPRNLTPDMETGIGKWSEDDIARTLMTGTRPDGSALLPPMPVPDLVHLTDDDAHAIAAYLKSIPAVKHQAPARIPPDAPVGAAVVVPFPPPPAWDAPRTPPSGAAPAGMTGATETAAPPK